MRSQDTPAGLVEGFLDAMALLLVPPGAGSVVGCSLDLPLAGRPTSLANQSIPKRPAPGDNALDTGNKYIKTSTDEGYPDQEPPTFTLRIARSGPVTESVDQEQQDFATRIILFLQQGRRFHAKPCFRERFLHPHRPTR